MKILVIPDVHQTGHWKEAVSKINECDKVVFLGDYFDTHGGNQFSGQEAADNFEEIMKFKEANSDKVITLIGNHDLHYLVPGIRASQFQNGNFKIFNKVINQYREDLRVTVDLDGWNFSHAGISKKWAETAREAGFTDFNEILENDGSIKELLCYIENPNDPWGYGDCSEQGPCWIRPNALINSESLYDKMIVGHTAVFPVTGNCRVDMNGKKIIFTDTVLKNICFIFDTENIGHFMDMGEFETAMTHEQELLNKLGE